MNGLEVYEELGVKPHVHDFDPPGQIRHEAFEALPTWFLRRPRFWFWSCCGQRMKRMTKRITMTCKICGLKVTWTRGKWGFCDVCGGIEEVRECDGW